jgi:hypothetical protein
MKYRGWRVKLSSLISVQRHNRLPRLVIHEKYEKRVKLISRLIAGVAIATSLLTIQTWYWRLAIALAIFFVELFLERAIFLYTSIYVQPFPDFKIEGEKWTDMGFAFPANPTPDQLNVVGPVFSDRKYAHKFFELLSDWNYRKSEDIDNNICLSFIRENARQYSVYLYPNLKRESIGQFFEVAEEQQKHDKHGKEHQQLIILMIFCKVFRYGEEFGLKKFLELQSGDRPFWLKPFIKENKKTYSMMYDEKSILKYNFKLADRKQLGKKEIEYQFRPSRSSLR